MIKIAKLSIMGITTVAAIAACSDESTDDHSTATTDSQVSSPPATQFPTSCSSTPSMTFGLTSVEVAQTAGAPEGAKTVTWHTNSAIPMNSTVAFTLTSGEIMRGVKLQDGKLIANYVYSLAGGRQETFPIPPRTDSERLTVSAMISANDAHKLGHSWSADLEVDGRSSGKCTP